MDQHQPQQLVAFFNTKAQAESVTDELWHTAGFRHNQLGMAVPGGNMQEATTRTEAMEEKAADGTTTGAVTGGAIGLAAGAAAVALVPGVGPLLAGGLLAAGAAAGAAVGTFAGPFLAMGFSESEARRLGNEVKGGRTVLVIRAENETQAEKAVKVVKSHGGQIESSPTAMLAGR